MINQLPDKEQEIISEALIASVCNKKVIVVCPNNEVKQRLLMAAREYDVESAIEIQVPPRGIGKRAETVIIDWVVFEEEKPQ